MKIGHCQKICTKYCFRRLKNLQSVENSCERYPLQRLQCTSGSETLWWDVENLWLLFYYQKAKATGSHDLTTRTTCLQLVPEIQFIVWWSFNKWSSLDTLLVPIFLTIFPQCLPINIVINVCSIVTIKLRSIVWLQLVNWIFWLLIRCIRCPLGLFSFYLFFYLSVDLYLAIEFHLNLIFRTHN